MKRIFPAVLMALLLFLLSFPSIMAQAEGTIQGRVVNGTKGSEDKVGALTVSLQPSVNGAEEGEAITATTNRDGSFQFTNLDTASNRSYQVKLTYEEADYTSDPLQFTQGETTVSVEVTVWEATASNEAISVEQSHVVVYFGDKGFEVLEFYLFSNSSDRTYVGSKVVSQDGKKETIAFPLPEGASGIEPDGQGLMPCCVVSTDSGIADTMPVMPGTRELSFSYMLPYSSKDYVLSRTVEYPVSSLNLLVEDRGIRASSGDLTQVDPIQMQSASFLRFVKGAIPAGKPFSVTFTGLPTSSSQERLKQLGLALAVLGLVVGIGFPLMRARRAAPVRNSLPTFEEEREELLIEIARLDDSFEAGGIPEDEYRKLRLEKKRHLIELESAKEERS